MIALASARGVETACRGAGDQKGGSTQLLDSIPDFLVFVLVFFGMLVAFEIGFRIGEWRARRNPDEKDGPTNTLVGALLALMAFLLAITMGMASDRFDTRRGLVQQEANAIGTTYLRAGYLQQPQSDQVRNFLREYATQRIATADPADVAAKIARSDELMRQTWAITEQLVRENPNSPAIAIYTESVNETIDVSASRITAANNRVPEPILLFLLIGSVLATGLVGYDAGLTRRRSLIAAALLIVLFSTVIYLVVDINQPTSGIFQISQQPLITLEQELGPPTTT